MFPPPSNPSASSAGIASAAHPTLPALDGLRAIAILGVFIFHIWAPVMPGGFSGVDVFFVLSGFLITSIIYNDCRHEQFAFGEFYLRRIQRLLPNALCTIAGTLFLWHFFLPQGQSIEAGRHGFWTLFYLPNIYVWKFLGGYWGDGAEWAAFTHFWSLGVEEQYYILFPFCFVILARWFRILLKPFLLLALAGSFALCFYGTFHWPAATFYSLPTRLWELLLGSALAVFTGGIFRQKIENKNRVFNSVFNEILSAGGILLITFSFVFGSEKNFLFPGFIVLAPTLGSALVLYSIITGETALSKLLSTRPFVAVGKISYSLYLWHWPLIVFAKFRAQYAGADALTGALIGAGASIALSVAAYFFVEKPLRQRGSGRRQRLAIIAGGFAAVAVFCAYTVTRDGFSPEKYGPVVSSLNLYDVAAKPLDSELNKVALKHSIGGSKTFWEKLYNRTILHEGEGGRVSDLWTWHYTGRHDSNGIFTGIFKSYKRQETPKKKVAVIGSSHACMYSKLIDDICRDAGADVLFWGYSATEIFEQPPARVIFDKDRFLPKFYAARLAKLREWKPDVLFLIAPWNDKTLSRDLTTFLEQTASIQNMKIFFVTELPMLDIGSRENLRATVSFLEAHSTAGSALPALFPGYREDVRRRAHAIAEKIAGDPKYAARLKIIPAGKLFYRADGSVRYADKNAATGKTDFYYMDSNHLSDTGTARPELRQLFNSAFLPPL